MLRLDQHKCKLIWSNSPNYATWTQITSAEINKVFQASERIFRRGHVHGDINSFN